MANQIYNNYWMFAFEYIRFWWTWPRRFDLLRAKCDGDSSDDGTDNIVHLTFGKLATYFYVDVTYFYHIQNDEFITAIEIVFPDFDRFKKKKSFKNISPFSSSSTREFE